MAKTKFASAFIVWVVVVGLIMGCTSTVRPTVPFVSDKGLSECLATVFQVSWVPALMSNGVIVQRTFIPNTPHPTRTAQPNAELPDSAIIERLGRSNYSQGVYQLSADRAWDLKDARLAAQLYCTILKLPSVQSECPDAILRKGFRMRFNRGAILLDDFLFYNYGCGQVFLDLASSTEPDNILGYSGERDMRWTNGCFWNVVASVLNVSVSELTSPSGQDFANETEEADAEATAYAGATATRSDWLTRMPTYPVRVQTRQARVALTSEAIYARRTVAARTRRAARILADETATRTPTLTPTRTPLFTATPTPFPPVKSNCQ